MATSTIFPTLSEIKQRAKDLIRGFIPEAGLGTGEDYDHEAGIMSAMVWQLYQAIRYGIDQIFPESADETYLQRHANLYGISRKVAAKSVGFALLLNNLDGGTQGAGSTITSTSGVAVVTDAAATITTAAWVPKTVQTFDDTKPDRFVVASAAGMAVGDVFLLGGYKYAIKSLPGGGAVLIYGRLKNTAITGLTLTAIPGARVAITASVAGASGNLEYDTAMTVATPGANVDAEAFILELSGGADLETLPQWAGRIQDVKAERAAGGNREQVHTWILEVLGTERAFVYDLFRGLGTWDAVPQGISGARHLSGTKITEIQDYIVPLVPTDLKPGKVAAGSHDGIISDFTELLQDVSLTLIPGPGYGPDWQGTFTVNAGSTTTRITLTADPTGRIVAGNRVAVRVGIFNRLEMVVVEAVDAGGLNVSPALSVAPNAAETVFPGSSLIEPVRDALEAMFDDLGPGDTNPPTRFPAPTTANPSELPRALIDRVVMGVTGVRNLRINTPAADVTPAAKQQVVLNRLTLLHQ